MPKPRPKGGRSGGQPGVTPTILNHGPCAKVAPGLGSELRPGFLLRQGDLYALWWRDGVRGWTGCERCRVHVYTTSECVSGRGG